jgi:hypothetical protein
MFRLSYAKAIKAIADNNYYCVTLKYAKKFSIFTLNFQYAQRKVSATTRLLHDLNKRQLPRGAIAGCYKIIGSFILSKIFIQFIPLQS